MITNHRKLCLLYLPTPLLNDDEDGSHSAANSYSSLSSLTYQTIFLLYYFNMTPALETSQQ